MASVTIDEKKWQDTADPADVVAELISVPQSIRPQIDHRVEAVHVPAPLPSSRFIWTLRGVCCVALGISGFLAYAAMIAGEVPGCGGGGAFDCSHVLHTKWSKVLGIPVSVPALGLYTLALGALFTCRPKMSETQRKWAWGIATMAGVSAGLAAIYFISLQAFVIKHYCQYCLGAHTCGLILCGAILWKRPVGNLRTAAMFGVALLAIGGLLATQAMAEEPPTFTEIRYDGPETTKGAAATDEVEGLDAAPTDSMDDFDEAPTDSMDFDEAPMDE